MGRDPLSFIIHQQEEFTDHLIYKCPRLFLISILKYSEKVEQPSIDEVNIARVGGVTRSGRIYAPKDTKKEDAPERRNITIAKKARITEKEKEENVEFLKFISQSEYELMDQLKQTPANISLLSLLMNSENHRKVLIKVLNEAHVDKNISVEKLEGIVGHIIVNNYATFSDAEIPVEGRGHSRALNILVKCLNHLLTKVLVDNGSLLNVLPKAMLDKLPYDKNKIRSSSTIVRAFDESRREVGGEIKIPIQVEPFEFQIHFQVMDIKPAYNCLFGRPWIHAASVVPSSVHQKLKFIIGDKLVIISREKDLMVACPKSAGHVEANEEALETAFQSLEITNTTLVIKTKSRKPDP
ncbi:hypothetical protein CR513_34179, partial [Mucuna pruriens]